MLTIRPEQLAVFRAQALGAFEVTMVNHLAAFSPPLFKAVGEAALLQAVRLGIGRAAGYGFDLRGPVRLYLELMLLLGSHFDTDPQYPWAAAILQDRETGPQMERAERLYRQTLDYQAHVGGPDDARALKALRNIRGFAGTPVQFAPAALVPFMLDALAQVYPEKTAFVGEAALAELIRKAGLGARNMRFVTPRAMALVAVLMLAFGHGCGADPLYPWITRTLKDETITDPEARAKRLEKRALTWLDQVLVNLEKAAPT